MERKQTPHAILTQCMNRVLTYINNSCKCIIPNDSKWNFNFHCILTLFGKSLSALHYSFQHRYGITKDISDVWLEMKAQNLHTILTYISIASNVDTLRCVQADEYICFCILGQWLSPSPKVIFSNMKYYIPYTYWVVTYTLVCRTDLRQILIFIKNCIEFLGYMKFYSIY